MISPLAYLWMLLLWAPHVQEHNEGVYMLSPSTKKVHCENEVPMLIGGAKVCISKKPILNLDQVDYITDIMYDPVAKKNYIDIGFSSAAIQTFNRGFSSLPNNRYALVVHNDVMCIIKIEAEITNRYIRMGYDLTLKDLTAVHDMLKTVKP
ncbi:hypothetical protein [Chryseolinea serpens]|nr:hypothetical protein [Chryseolinea serpens]